MANLSDHDLRDLKRIVANWWLYTDDELEPDKLVSRLIEDLEAARCELACLRAEKLDHGTTQNTPTPEGV